MKALHVLKDLEPGGIQYLLLDMLSNRRHFEGQFALFIMGTGRLYKNFKAIPGLEIYDTVRTRKIDFRVIEGIRQAVQDFEPDVVHTHHSAEMLSAWWALRKYPRIRKAHTFHVSLRAETAIDIYIYKFLSPKFDMLFTPSESLKSEFARAGFGNVKGYQILHNGIDPARVQRKSSKAESRKQLGLPMDGVIIGMAGSFYNGIRDQETLIRALPGVKSAQSVYLAFAGATSSEYFVKNTYYHQCIAKCKSLNIADQVFFLGNIAPVHPFYAALDLYVHSSKHDTFGLAVLEAIYNDLPLVVSDIAVFREIFGSHSGMESFTPSDADELATKITHLLKFKHDDRQREAVTLQKKYSIESHLKNLWQAYDNEGNDTDS